MRHGRDVSPPSASKRLLGRCEPDFPDLAELHMLLGLPEIVVGLHGKPTLRRTAKRLGKAKRYFRADTASTRKNAIQR